MNEMRRTLTGHAARNLKFYPLSLRKALDKELKFIANDFYTRTCMGDKKRIIDMGTWELLNLQPSTVLDLPDRMYKEFGISPKFLEGVLKHYNIQSTGKDVLERDFDIKPPQLLLATSRHYSWPKGGGKRNFSPKSKTVAIDTTQQSPALVPTKLLGFNWTMLLA